MNLWATLTHTTITHCLVPNSASTAWMATNCYRRTAWFGCMGSLGNMATVSVTVYTSGGDLEPMCQLRCETYWQATIPTLVCSYKWRHHWTLTPYFVPLLNVPCCVFVTYCLWFRTFPCRCLCCNWTHMSCLHSDYHCIDLLKRRLCLTKTTLSWEIYRRLWLPIKQVRLLFSSVQLSEDRNWHEFVPHSKPSPRL